MFTVCVLESRFCALCGVDSLLVNVNNGCSVVGLYVSKCWLHLDNGYPVVEFHGNNGCLAGFKVNTADVSGSTFVTILFGRKNLFQSGFAYLSVGGG